MKKPYIICVDDDRGVLNSLKEQLKTKFESEFNIEVSESGEEALDLINMLLENGEEVKVIIVDYFMPAMRGDELLIEVNKISSRTIKILLTGHANIDGVANSINKADLYRFIPKPWEKEDILLTVAEGIKSYEKDRKLEEQHIYLLVMNENLNSMVKVLQKVIDSFHNILKINDYKEFLNSVLREFNLVVHDSVESDKIFNSGLILSREGKKYKILDGIGDFNKIKNISAEKLLGNEILEKFDWSIDNEAPIINGENVIASFASETGTAYVIFLNRIENASMTSREVLEIFCANSAIAVDKIFLKNEIEATQKEIIFTLSEIAEARSKETGNHVRRVAEYAKIIARKYGLPEAETEIIRLAAPLHDIGKLAVPDAILNKPAKLTVDEFEIMKTHARVGYEMLKTSNREILRSGSIIALQHHEKFNGTGYPNGLKGEEIHVYGRIIAVVDVFDALGNERPYKKAWELDKIIDYFMAEKGKHFDPLFVGIFMESLDEFVEISNNFKDPHSTLLLEDPEPVLR